MLANTKLRTKLVAIAVPPILILAMVAAYGAFSTFVRDSMSASELQSDVRLISILAVVGIISSILAVLAMSDRIMAPIIEVTDGAVELAENRLPVLIEGLRDPNAEIPDFEFIDFSQKNELGALAAALNSVQVTASEISAEQKNIFKRGISDLVVNLARRNQSLLDRQIESIDRLESDEEDPDRLEQLFSLDHLATRMRRNAESLLVLAGSEPARRRGGPVSVADVLRVAMSEIEDYRKVHLSNMEHAEIGAQGAVDLAHLMSELMENATQFSPPDTVVEVKGAMDDSGAYVIGIIDRGIGMNDEQLYAANDLLRNPPDLGITLTRSLGFLVVGQLSRRLGVGVELVKTAGSGTTAIVVVPAHLLAGGVRQSMQEIRVDAPQPTPTIPAAQTSPLGAQRNAGQSFEVPSQQPSVAGTAEWEQPRPAPAMDASVIEAPAQWEQPAPESSFDAPAFDSPSPANIDTPEQEAPSFSQPPPASHTWDQMPSEEVPQPQTMRDQPESSVSNRPGWQPPTPESESDFPEQSYGIQGWDDGAGDALAAEAATIDHAHQSYPQAPAAPSADYIPGWDDPPEVAVQGYDEPAPDLPSHEANQFDVPQYDPQPAPQFDAPQYQPPQYEVPQYEVPQYESQPAPQAEAPQYEVPQYEAPQYEAPHEPDPAPLQYEVPQARNIDPLAAAFQTPVPSQMPPVSRLEQAIPSGESFDAGMEELLQEPQQRTTAGLARRDRATNQAPTSEGRPVAASVRSPDEVRNMLARYRSGLKGNPGNGDQT